MAESHIHLLLWQVVRLSTATRPYGYLIAFGDGDGAVDGDGDCDGDIDGDGDGDGDSGGDGD